MLDVVTIGSATLDIFLTSDQFKIDTSHADGVFLCERYEGKIEAQEVVMTSGGGATNSAVSYARKGLQVAPVIEMGRDPAAEMILLELAREPVSPEASRGGHVDLQFVIQESNETTAVSAILLSGRGGNSIVTYRGASRMLTASDIPFDKIGMALKPGGWIHLTNVGGDMEVVETVLRWAREKGRKVFWNPGGAEIERISKGRSLRTQGPSLSRFPDVLQLNREEASQFFEINFLDDDVWKSEHCPPRLAVFGEAGPTLAETILIITDGAHGGRVCNQGACTWYEGIKTMMVDSTGAGDAFGSGFVAALMLGKPIEDAIEWGKRQAASVVSFIGAKRGLLTEEEMMKK